MSWLDEDGRVWVEPWKRFPLWLRNGWRNRLYPRLAALATAREPPDAVIDVWPGPAAPLGPRIALFVHFDPDGQVAPFVRDYLAALRVAGLDIVFATNTGALRPESTAYLRTLCAAVVVRRNRGHDFGAMRDALVQLGLPRSNTALLLLANDSVYGPLVPLAPVLDRIDFAAADVWGATESWQGSWHLQSYFLAFGPAALASPAWAVFWTTVRPVGTKLWIVRQFEMGLSQTLLRDGLRLRALWPMPALLAAVTHPEADGTDPRRQMRRQQVRRVLLAAAAGRPLNPTSELWRQLLETGYPFLKRDLLRVNPAMVADLADWRGVVEILTGTVPESLERDLRLTVAHRSA